VADFLTVRDLAAADIGEVFAVAAEMKADRARFATSLAGQALAMLFEKPSLRTRTTFDVGIQQLGGFALYYSPSEVQLGKRESVHDVAKNLERMVQGIMIRTFAHTIVEEMATHAAIPIINGLTDHLHPCQAMADFFTIQEVKGELAGRRLCYVGDGNNVAHSLLLAGARLGVHVTVACPEGYDPDEAVLALAQADAATTGAAIAVTHDPVAGVREADVVYTDTWASMGQESEAVARRAVFQPFQVNGELMRQAQPDAMFMHCLPAHRGDEVTDDVIDAPSSVVFQQAENRLHVQKAIMLRLMA